MMRLGRGSGEGGGFYGLGSGLPGSIMGVGVDKDMS